MTGPELDALIESAQQSIDMSRDVSWSLVEELISELKIYRAMSLRLERCVHELVKEIEHDLLP